MSSQLIPNPKEPTNSTDYIYGERMEPYEGRMNFFLNEKIDVKKDNVKEEDKETVDGLESIIQRFTSYNQVNVAMPDNISSEMIVDGVEAAGNVKKLIDFLVQFAKDAVDFILNLVNNRITRIDNREYRVSMHRKRDGIVSTPVKYPASTRRLLDPLTVSLDPNWVITSLRNVKVFYLDVINTYRGLTNHINDANSQNFDLQAQIRDTMNTVSRRLGVSLVQDSYSTKILPGNRRLIIDNPSSTTLDKVGIYFQTSSTDVKLRSPDFEASGPMIDDTLKEMRELIKEIRSNQSTVSQLYRTFERAAKSFEHKSEKLTPEQRSYLNWLIRFNKRLMTVTVQYVLTSVDAGLDFVNAGLRK